MQVTCGNTHIQACSQDKIREGAKSLAMKTEVHKAGQQQ